MHLLAATALLTCSKCVATLAAVTFLPVYTPNHCNGIVLARKLIKRDCSCWIAIPPVPALHLAYASSTSNTIPLEVELAGECYLCCAHLRHGFSEASCRQHHAAA